MDSVLSLLLRKNTFLVILHCVVYIVKLYIVCKKSSIHLIRFKRYRPKIERQTKRWNNEREQYRALFGPFRASVQYIPYYGGAKGQYLEIKKDSLGRITGERIVTEEYISSENIVKNSNENLLAKVMAKNLQNLKTLSTNLLKLHNLGRKTGSLGNVEKSRYKTQLASLGEAASNIIKLIEEVDDVDTLFKKNATVRNKDDEYYDDDVGEEGVGIDASSDEMGGADGFLGKGTIAEAKPVGLAVVGENGLAASRPKATAVAASGVALALPQATAIAGVDPGALGIKF